jgi:hypothetical protein
MTLSQLQWLGSASWHDLYRMIRKTMERYAHGLLKVLFQHLPRGAEKCHATSILTAYLQVQLQILVPLNT